MSNDLVSDVLFSFLLLFVWNCEGFGESTRMHIVNLIWKQGPKKSFSLEIFVLNKFVSCSKIKPQNK